MVGISNLFRMIPLQEMLIPTKTILVASDPRQVLTKELEKPPSKQASPEVICKKLSRELLLADQNPGKVKIILASELCSSLQRILRFANMTNVSISEKDCKANENAVNYDNVPVYKIKQLESTPMCQRVLKRLAKEGEVINYS